MIQELLTSGAALILGLIQALVGLGGPVEREVAAEPPPMPALENWNPGVNPPTLEEVIFNLIKGAEDTIAPPPAEEPPAPRPAPRPTQPVFPAPTPSVPVVTPTIPETPIDEPLPPVEEPTDTAATSALLRGALVNIICMPPKGYNLRGTSGSGVVIDPKGIIVTVAHIGQHFLIEDYPTKDSGTCVIRTGSPAKNAYEADLIYLSTDWIKENPTTITSSSPRGTGEYDFAFLAITQSLSGSLPSSFSAVRLAPEGQKIAAGDEVSIGSYGAEFLTSSQIRSSLYPTISFGGIQRAYRFAGNDSMVDIFSVQAGSAAQEGSSGGGVLDENNRFLGVITTRTVTADLSLRTLQAITIDHIRSAFTADTGKDLDSFLRGNTASLIAEFEDDAADLLDVIDDSIRAL